MSFQQKMLKMCPTVIGKMAQENAVKQSQTLEIGHSIRDGIIAAKMRKISRNQVRARTAADVYDACMNEADDLLIK